MGGTAIAGWFISWKLRTSNGCFEVTRMDWKPHRKITGFRDTERGLSYESKVVNTPSLSIPIQWDYPCIINGLYIYTYMYAWLLITVHLTTKCEFHQSVYPANTCKYTIHINIQLWEWIDLSYSPIFIIICNKTSRTSKMCHPILASNVSFEFKEQLYK